MWHSEKTAVKADGSFSFAALPPAKYTVRATFDENQPFYGAEQPSVEVKPGEAVNDVAVKIDR